MQTETIPARQGRAVRLNAGQHIDIVNTHGTQVLDTWSFAIPDTSEHMSMEHTRSINSRWRAQVGMTLVSSRRRPMLTIVADTSPGVHDTLLCACSKEVYRELGCEGYHDNCEDNLHAALRAMGVAFPATPAPLNLFMNVTPAADGQVVRAAPASRPGDTVTLRAEMDQFLVFSACPQDITLINGEDRTPRDAHVRVR
jgi:hypothetical protein